MKRKLVASISALMLIAIACGAYFYFRTPNAAPTGPVLVVKRGSITETASASGKIEPDVQVEVKSRASGTVTEVLVKEGDQVTAGQLLVQLDPTDAQRDLAEAKVARDRVAAELSASRASLNVSELDKKNNIASQEVAQKSADLGVGSTDAVRLAKQSSDVASANLALKRAQLNSSAAQLKTAELSVEYAELRLKETKIYAPIAGTVLDVAVEKGTIVSSALTNVSGGSAVVTIADLTDLRIVGAIDEAQIGRVSVGQRVEIRVDAHTDKVFKGVVDRVSPLGKETSSVVTFDVEIVIKDENVALLRSGMSADVEIITSEQNDVILVPLLAVQTAGKEKKVTLVGGAERVIKTGATDGSNMVVIEGLAEGDRVTLKAAAPAGSSRNTGNQNQNLRGMGMGMGGPPGGR
jgi:HlyD family secretion protein